MKRIFAVICMTLMGLSSFAQDNVIFEFSDGIENLTVKQNMERNLSNLLTAINTAQSHGTDINFMNIDIDDMASQGICMLWENVRFRCLDEEIIEHCLTKRAGSKITYQVRNIAIEMKPFDDSYEGELNQEVCVDFDTKGRIIDFNMTMGINQYARLMKEGIELNDLDRRLQIIHFCEQFKNAYNQKDIKFMENVFSDDALIITGKVMKRVPTEVTLNKPKIEYTVQGKEQYLRNLRSVFARQGYINVAFNDYSVKRHGSKTDYYGVTLVQKWNSTTYSDEGIVFLVWDFSNEDSPKIHVRTWQPMETDDSEIFTLNKFKLP